MKIFERIISLLIALAVIGTSAFAYDAGTLEYLDVIPAGVTDNTVLTREQLSFSIAKILMPDGEFEKTDTDFEDVKSDNPYSGYIRYVAQRGIMNGSGDGNFNPQSNISFNELSAVLVKTLGYGMVAEARGGWPGGYTSVASSLKLFNGTAISGGTISIGDLKAILLNLINTEVPEESVYTQNGNYESLLSVSGDNLLYAEKTLELYEYEAVITEIDYKNYRATLVMGEQDKNSKYNYGETVHFDVSGDINISTYKNLPAKFVVYDDKIIVDVTLDDGVSISYGVVDSVNNETVVTAYNINHINALTLSGDDNDYKFEAGCTFMVNGTGFTGTKLSLMDKYVKIVHRDDKIFYLSFYELADGGRIKKVDREYMSYTIGSSDRRLDKIREVEELIVVIDGENRNYNELKAGMLFSYWRSEDKKSLVIVASDKHLSDVFYGLNTSGNTLSLGTMDIEYTDDIYSSRDNTTFVCGENALLEYCDIDVIVSLDIYNKARYLVSCETMDSSTAYYGYILGYSSPTNSFYDAKMRIACISEEGIPTKDFTLSKNVTFDDSDDISSVIASAGTTDGSALFELEFNGNGEIKEFKSPTELDGFEGMTWSSSSFTSSWLPVAGRKLPISNTTPVICIGNNQGEVETHKLTFSSISGKIFEDAHSNGSRVYLRFFSYDEGQTLGMILMTGDIDIVPSSIKTGVADRVGKTMNNDGEIVDSVTIDDITYALASDNTVVPAAGDLVSFSESLFNPGEVKIDKTLSLKNEFSLWNGMGYGNRRTFRTGTVSKVDKSKISIVLDSAYSPATSVNLLAGDEYLCYYESGCKFFGIDSEGELSSLTYQDVFPGMEVALLIYRNPSWAADSVEQVYVRKD